MPNRQVHHELKAADPTSAVVIERPLIRVGRRWSDRVLRGRPVNRVLESRIDLDARPAAVRA